MSLAKLFPVEVRERTETELRVPLVLTPRVSLSVAVEPPVDPLDEPWRLKVWQLSDIPGGMEEVKGETVTAEGQQTYSGLPSGSYLVQVLDSRGNVLATKEAALASESAELTIELPLVWVEGDVRLGGDPIAADLLFGGRHSEQRMHLVADDQGEFLGYLPREGKWEVLVQGRLPEFETTLSGVEVIKRKGFGSARLEIRLPGTKVSGVVVDGRGNAVGGALVRAAQDSPVTFQRTQTDAEGRFRFRGLGEGKVEFRAESARGSSPAVPVDLSEDEPVPELRLVVGDYRVISAQILGPDGPVPSAAVAATPLGPGGARMLVGIPEQITDIEGKVRVFVPSEADGLELLVLAPGYALDVLTLTGLERYETGTLALRVQELFGTLRIEAPGASEHFGLSEPFPILWVDGHVVGAYSLARWAQINGVRNPDFRSMTVPAMPPGAYSACLLAVESAAQLSNPHVPASRCATGILAANGELELSIP